MTYGPWKDSGVKGLWTYKTDDTGRRISIRNEELHKRLDAERTVNRALCQQWRDAAVADGWAIEPTYAHEPQEQAFRLRRDGYVIQGLARPAHPEWGMPAPSIYIWGPDGLAIEPPLVYDSAAILRGVETCSKCHAHPVETERVGFAGRYCAPCATIVRPQIERPGWNA